MFNDCYKRLTSRKYWYQKRDNSKKSISLECINVSLQLALLWNLKTTYLIELQILNAIKKLLLMEIKIPLQNGEKDTINKTAKKI